MWRWGPALVVCVVLTACSTPSSQRASETDDEGVNVAVDICRTLDGDEVIEQLPRGVVETVLGDPEGRAQLSDSVSVLRAALRDAPSTLRDSGEAAVEALDILSSDRIETDDMVQAADALDAFADDLQATCNLPLS